MIAEWTETCEATKDVSLIALGKVTRSNLEVFLRPIKIIKTSERFEGKNKIWLTAKKLPELPPNGHNIFVCLNTNGDLVHIGTNLS